TQSPARMLQSVPRRVLYPGTVPSDRELTSSEAFRSSLFFVSLGFISSLGFRRSNSQMVSEILQTGSLL
ncbi:MAG: hypothetical protein ACK58T_25730, partial [Phycisphaerae bacterium]